MTLLLDAPTTDVVPLEESILEGTVPCRHGHGEASYRWAMRCCGTERFLCADHDTAGFAKATVKLTEPGRPHVCRTCGELLGTELEFNQVYRRHQI